MTESLFGNRARTIAGWLLAGWLLVSPASSGAVDEAGDGTPFRVLVLHSYHRGFEWTDSLQAGIEKVFAESGLPVEFSVEYMDAKRHPGEILFHDLTELYGHKYERWPPKLILSCDDDALNFLFAYRDRLFPGVPVVFCGLNVEDYDPAILEGRSGYTGVAEKLDLESTIALIPRVQPEVTRVAFVHDRTTTGLANRRLVEALAPRFADRLTFVFPERDSGLEGDSGSGFNGGLSERELLVYLEALTPDTAIFFLGFYRDRFDVPLGLETILPKISRAARVPVYGCVETYFGHGILGGNLLSAEVHGGSAARKALRILQGEAVAEIPVTVESSNRFMFDDRQRRRFKIPEKRLPEGAILLYAPESFLKRHSVAIGLSLGVACLAFLFFLMIFFNMARRLRAEERAAASERKYRLLADHSADVIWTMDAEHRPTYVSPAAERLFGYSPKEMLRMKWEDWLTTESAGIVRERIAKRLKDWECVDIAGLEMIRKDGRTLWTEVVAQGFRDAAGRPMGVVGVIRDITERRRAEAALRKSERRYREIYQRTPVMLHSIDPDGRLISVSDYWLKVMEYERDEVLGRPSTDFLTDESRRRAIEENIPRFLETDEAWNVPYQFVKKSGEVIDVLLSAVSERDRQGQLLRSLAVLQDVTEQKLAEETLARQARKMRIAQQMARLGHWNYDVASGKPEWSDMMFEIMGCDPEDGVPDLEAHRKFIHPDDWEVFERGVRGAENGVPYELELRVFHPDGRLGYVVAQGHPQVDANGSIRQLFGITLDITDRKEAKRALKESEERLRLVLEGSGLGLWDWDIPGGSVRRNARWAEILGYTLEEIETTVTQWTGLIHPEDREAAMNSVQDHLAGRSPIHEMEYRMLAKNGEIRWILDRARVVRRNSRGEPVRMCGTHADITARKREESQRQELERRMERARRHESLATMAGAVAHNFNNILMAILGNLDIAMDAHPELHPARQYIQGAQDAAQRAVRLGRLMLLYVGQGQEKQIPLCLRNLVRSHGEPIRRMVPDGVTVRFPPEDGSEPAWISANGARVGEALLNLVTNAAEALGDRGGRIDIAVSAETLSAEALEESYIVEKPPPGRFVALRVSDDGPGMSEETRRRLFEPYYSTKFPGRGLGLAAVLGIVRGHGGAIRVRSASGTGCDVTLLFPEGTAPADGKPEAPEAGD